MIVTAITAIHHASHVPHITDPLCHCSRPVTVGATRPVFQIIVAIISIYYTYWAYAGIAEAVTAGVFQPQPLSVRLTILELRNKSVPPAEGNPVDFGLLFNGCKLQQRANTSNGSAVVEFSSPVAANGYFLQIPAGMLAALHPVKWVVEAQAEGHAGWWLVGASVRRGLGTLASYYPNLAYPTPMGNGDGVLVVADGQPDWPWILADIGTYIGAGAGWSLCVWAATIGRPWAVPGFMCSLFGINSILQAASAVGYYDAGNWRESVEACVYSAGNGIMSLVLCVNERFIIPGLLTFGAIFCLAVVGFTLSHCIANLSNIQ
jgi:hypothetical protein